MPYTFKSCISVAVCMGSVPPMYACMHVAVRMGLAWGRVHLAALAHLKNLSSHLLAISSFLFYCHDLQASWCTTLLPWSPLVAALSLTAPTLTPSSHPR